MDVHGTFSPAQLILPLIVLVVFLGFWAWMFRDMQDNPELTPDERAYWTRILILLLVFGAVLYYANVYTRRKRR